MNAPTVTVVIVAYRSAEHLGPCVAAVEDACRDHRSEIIVVDNDSPDDTRSALAGMDGVRLLRMGFNAGFAAACNAGVAASHTPYVCFVNPDSRPSPGAIDALVEAAEGHPGHALFSGKVLTPDGVVEAGCVTALPSLWEYVCFATGLSTAFPRSKWFDPASLGSWDRGDQRQVPAVSGAFLLVRRTAFAQLGGFDERYFMYSEDIDLSERAARAQMPPVFVPAALALHTSGGSSTSGAKATMVLRGKVTFVRLHWRRPRRDVALLLLLLGTAVRAAGSRLTGRGSKWRDAWNRRSEWLGGW